MPIQIVRYGLLPDSGGVGRWRGGLATTLDFRVSAPNTRITARNRDRSRFRPWGILGGGAGEPSNFILNPGTAKERVLGNTDTVTCEPGDVVHIHSPGGGGRGSPLDREPERVALDVTRGYVTAERARRDYGVVLRDGAVDAEATALARAAMSRTNAHFAFGPERTRTRRFGRRRLSRSHQPVGGVAGALAVFCENEIVRIDAGGGAPLKEVFGLVREAYADVPAV